MPGILPSFLVAVFAILSIRLFASPWILLSFVLPLLVLAPCIGFFAHIYLGLWIDRNIRQARRTRRSSARPLAFSTPAAWQVVLTRSKWSRKSPQNLPYLEPEYPSASAAINDILIMIVRDFVLTWYTEISSSAAFPSAVTDTVHGCLGTLLKRLDSIDLPSLVVRRILPRLTAHVEQFRSSETALRGAGLERHLTQSEELDLLLASRYVGKAGSLHPAVGNLSTTFTRQTEEAHLRSLVDAVLPFVLSSKDAGSKATHIVARELVACCVLAPVTNLLSDPDFWNRTIDQLATAAIRQQKLISRVRNALELQSPASRVQNQQKDSQLSQPDTITLQSDPRQFDSFLRSINRCDSLLDARRVKNDIMGEIRRTRALLSNHENEDWIEGRRTEEVVTFLDRLYTAKRKIEKRIAILGGQDDSRSNIVPDAETVNLTLREVLGNPTSLSYFMEFMDRRGRSLLVQFWLTVESFKNPLEVVDSDSENDENEPLSDPISAATLKEDLNMIKDLYFAGSSISPVLECIPDKHVDAIRSYATTDPSSSHERKARRSVMLAQRHIEREMDQDFDSFRRSDLWFRVISDNGTKQTAKELPVSTRPRLREHAPSSTNLFVSIVQGLTPDISRSQSHLSPALSSRVDSSSSLAGMKITPPVIQKRFSTDSGRSSAVSTPGISRVFSSQSQTSGNLELLMSSGAEADEGGPSRAPLFDEAEDGQLLSADAAEAQRMAAIQAAVTDIIASEGKAENDTTFASASGDSLDRARYDYDAPARNRQRRPIFGDVQTAASPMQDGEAEADEEDDQLGPLQMATPGDLQLPYEIARLEDKIASNQSQDVVLDTLIRKAELTGDAEELRVLRKSKSSLEREMRQLVFQKTQYEQQNTASKLLPGKTKAIIVNSTSGEEDGKQVIRYLVEVQQPASGWVVARRYSEFLQMHQRLKERYAMVKGLEFPGKHLVTALSSQMVDTRRVGLEKYLQSLLTIPVVCESQELRAFLSRDSPFIAKSPVDGEAKEATQFPGHNIVRNVYKTFTESIDDVLFGPSMLEVMIGRLTRQAAEYAGIVGTAVNDEDLVAQALRASGKAAPEDTLNDLPGDLKPLSGEGSTSPFASPICDLVLAIFELDKKNNWLRRQAIIIILQQVLGDTVERKVRESTKTYLDEVHVLSYINIVKDALWPGGRLRPETPERTPEEKTRTRENANRKLTSLLPDVAANMMGRSNARRGARRIFAVLQNRRLNQHIVYTIMDEVFAALFPEAVKSFPRGSAGQHV